MFFVAGRMKKTWKVVDVVEAVFLYYLSNNKSKTHLNMDVDRVKWASHFAFKEHLISRNEEQETKFLLKMETRVVSIGLFSSHLVRFCTIEYVRKS